MKYRKNYWILSSKKDGLQNFQKLQSASSIFSGLVNFSLHFLKLLTILNIKEEALPRHKFCINRAILVFIGPLLIFTTLAYLSQKLSFYLFFQLQLHSAILGYGLKNEAKLDRIFPDYKLKGSHFEGEPF